MRYEEVDCLGQFGEIVDDIVGLDPWNILLPLVGRDEDRFHVQLLGALDVTVHVVTDEESLLRFDLQGIKGFLEEPHVRFAIAVVTGNDDRIEVT